MKLRLLFIVAVNIAISSCQYCYTCTGEGLDPCSLFTNQHVVQCGRNAIGCAIAAGTLPNKNDVTVERACLYVQPEVYCQKIKGMVQAKSNDYYYCNTCKFNYCNGGNISSIVNKLQLGPVTVDDYPKIPTENPCNN